MPLRRANCCQRVSGRGRGTGFSRGRRVVGSGSRATSASSTRSVGSCHNWLMSSCVLSRARACSSASGVAPARRSPVGGFRSDASRLPRSNSSSSSLCTVMRCNFSASSRSAFASSSSTLWPSMAPPRLIRSGERVQTTTLPTPAQAPAAPPRAVAQKLVPEEKASLPEQPEQVRCPRNPRKGRQRAVLESRWEDRRPFDVSREALYTQKRVVC
uniref:Uncharacterized protein n=1 Tax=Mustela putorius furo TaxID=9669 RepID=M3YEW5_MUSPF